MNQQKFIVAVPFARRLPDPVYGNSLKMERHLLFVPVRAVPEGLPLDPNARKPNISKRIYKDVERSLLEEDGSQPGSFHLKNKGITIVAESVEKLAEDQYQIIINSGQGILDGGHTYELICSHHADAPENQYVKLEVLTHVPVDWIVDIAGGLNTSVQVQEMSLNALAGKFDWLKDELKGEPYYSQIAWRENDPGDFDARDVIALLTCFDINSFSNEGQEHPVVAFSSKAQVLDRFNKSSESYQALRPILKNILHLHDTIRFTSREYWNQAGGRFGRLGFVEQKKRGEFNRPFVGGTAKSRLMNGALYPMLGAFRWMVEAGPDGKTVGWRGGFDQVLEAWDRSAEDLMRITVQASQDLGGNPNTLGKSKNHWASLHAKVAMRDLMAKAEAN